MSLVEWSDDLLIGIEHIDAQHKQLLALINELHTAVEQELGREVVLPIIDKLGEYAITHFRDEEELLIQQEFPDLAYHQQEHQEFMKKVHQVRSRYEGDRKGLTLNLRNYLLGWFFNHIKTEDLDYRHFLRKKGVLPEAPARSGQNEEKGR